MKTKSLLTALAALVTVLVSCKKESQTASFAGKWYEVKLNMYETVGAGERLYETTYLQPFNTLDYAQFNADGTILSSTDHYFYINMPGQMVAPQAIPQQTATWTYKSIGNKYTLDNAQNDLPNYSGFSTTDTLSIIHYDTLFWHSVLISPSGLGQTVTDMYFVK